jgi:hypothetical protein
MPKSALGRWTGWFLLGSLVLFAMLIAAYNTDVLGVIGQGTAGGLVWWIVTAISIVGTLVTGAVSWLRFKDHSVVVILATMYGILGTILLAMGAIPEN